MNIAPVCLIAEKPSQLRAYLEVLNSKDYQKIEPYHYFVSPCKIFPNGCHMLSCRGFLLSLKDPSEYKGFEHLKNWNIDDVPFQIPRPYEYVPGDGDGIKQQLEHLKRVIRTAVSKYGPENVQVITATDIDQSGALIAQQVYDYSFTREEWAKVKKSTLFINSLERTEVYKGLMNLKTYDLTARMAESCVGKQASDWTVGLGLSRVVTILAKEQVQQAIQRLNANNGSNAFLAPIYQSANKQIPQININADDIFPRGSAARIGRVSTVTLHFIYNRENEIKNFVSKDFYEMYAEFTTERGEKYKGKLQGFKTFEPNEVKQLLAKHQLQNGVNTAGIVSDVKMERKKKGAPSLHSLTTLQATANRKWKMTAKQTLDTLQQLYEKKYTTYPRTSSNFITESEFGYLAENLDKYKAALNIQFENAYTTPRKRYVDSSKVAEHHACILTRTIVTQQMLSELSPMEQNIYLEIARTTLGMFAPDYEYDQATITTELNQLPFVSIGKTERVKGFQVLWESEKSTSTKKNANKASDDDSEQSDDENQALPSLQPNQRVNGSPSVKTGKTQPPQRYTEASLLEAMETAGKFVENEEDRQMLKEVEGIGTPATRADVINGLKEAQYVVVEKNRFVPTAKAMIVCRMTQGTMLSNPETTAKWETYLKNIELGKGNANAETFIERNLQFVQHLKGYLLETVKHPIIQQYIEATVISVNQNVSDNRIVCLKCKKGDIRMFQSKDKKNSFYSCSTYKTEQECGFMMSNTFYGNKLTAAQIKQLLTKGITSSEVKLKSKGGKEYKAKIRLQPDTFKMEVVFNNTNNKKTTKK